MVHISGFSGSISGLHFRVNKWSTSETTMRVVVSEDLCPFLFPKFSKRGSDFLVFWFKNRLFKKGKVAIPFSISVVVIVGGC